MLIEAEADLGAPDNNGNTPLHNAIYTSNIPMIQLLLSNGADVNTQRGHDKATPLMCAVMNFDVKVTELLVENGADVNCQDYRGRTPLMWVCQSGSEYLVNYLLDHGADSTLRDSTNNTPILRAKLEGHEGIVKILEDHFCKQYNIKSNTTGCDLDKEGCPVDEEKFCTVCWERPVDTAVVRHFFLLFFSRLLILLRSFGVVMWPSVYIALPNFNFVQFVANPSAECK